MTNNIHRSGIPVPKIFTGMVFGHIVAPLQHRITTAGLAKHVVV